MPDENQHNSPSQHDRDGLKLSDQTDVLPSIETPVKTSQSRKNSAAYTAVSSIPPSLPRDSDFSPYKPRQGPRATFRSPNSMRTLPMNSPPPFASPGSGSIIRHYGARESPRDSRHYQSDAASSIRSDSPYMADDARMNSLKSPRSPDYFTTRGSDRGTPTKESACKPGPLVLLHVTLLPCPTLAYSDQTMSELAPAYFSENWRLLREKLSDTVLARGILIPHPGEEYDLLEERLLQTLELCTPRVLDCGHFYALDEESETDSETDSGVSDVGRSSSEAAAICDSSHHGEDNSVCNHCSKPIQIPGRGIGSGTRRWNVKIFAANGLMRAGAWAAAWREMERVDVEIEPWLSEEVKRELDQKQSQQDAEEQKAADENDRLRFDIGEMERAKMEAEAAKRRMEDEMKILSAALASAMRPADAKAVPLGFINDLPKEDAKLTPTPASQRIESASSLRPGGEISLYTVLGNYIYLLAQDRRNIALGVLSILVIVLAFVGGSSKATTRDSLVSLPQKGIQLVNHQHVQSSTAVQSSGMQTITSNTLGRTHQSDIQLANHQSSSAAQSSATETTIDNALRPTSSSTAITVPESLPEMIFESVQT